MHVPLLVVPNALRLILSVSFDSLTTWFSNFVAKDEDQALVTCLSLELEVGAPPEHTQLEARGAAVPQREMWAFLLKEGDPKSHGKNNNRHPLFSACTWIFYFKLWSEIEITV